MKQSVKNIMTVATFLFAVVGAWAEQTVNIVYTNADRGTVTSSVSNGICTLTATPASGYYITAAELVAVTIVDGGLAQAPRQAPAIGSSVTVTATDATADPSGVTTYTFTMPTDENLGVEVTADFQQRISIAGATIADVPSRAYDGKAYEPRLDVTLGNTALVLDTDYSVAYADNISAGTATATITGIGKYMDTATKEYTITAATATITATDKTVTFTGAAQALDGVSVTAGSFVVTYYTAEADRSKGSNGTNDAPVNAGTYYVQVTQGDANYSSTPVDVTFTINPKTLTDAMVTLSAVSFEYTGETQKPEVTVADGEFLTAEDYTITNEGGVEVGEYTVTVTAKRNYTGTVTKTYNIINRTLSDDDVTFAAGQQWATYYTSTEDLALPEGIAAYVVTAVGTTSVSVQAINYVPKNVPVLLEKTDAVVEGSDNVSANQLMGTTEPLAVSTIKTGTVYVLYNNEFVKTISGTIPAHRCYLVVSTAVAESGIAPRLSINHGGDTTGIMSTVNNRQPAGNWSDLNGRTYESKPAKEGIYIWNGKKVVINK